MATNNPRPTSARFTASKRPAAPGSARHGAAKPAEEPTKRSSTARLAAQAKPAAPAKPVAPTKPAAQTKPAAPAKPAPVAIDVEEHDATSTADLAKLAAEAEAPTSASNGSDDSAAPADAPSDDHDASPAPASARTAKAKPAGASSRKAPIASGTGRYAAKKSGGFGKWVVVGVVVVLAIAGLSYGPVRRNLALSHLDACKDPAKASEAIAAADAFLVVVGNSESYTRVAIIGNRGPVEAQIHLAKTLKLFSSLVQISERPLTDAPGTQTPPRPDLPVISQDQRTAALIAAAEVFNDTHTNDLLPDDLAKWAKDGMLKRELAIAAMRLIAKTKPKNANDIFSSVANEADQDPLRVNAALDGIGELSDATNLGFAIGLLSSRVADLAITRTALTDKIARFSNPDHLPRLIELLNSPKDAIRAIAIESMGGVNMRLGDTPEHVRRREELGKLITPKLDPATSPVELAAALKAVKALRLSGARDAVLALAPKIKGLMLDGIGEDFIAETLGKSLISSIPDVSSSSSTAEGKKSDAQFAAETVRAAGEELIAKLIVGLDNDGTRTVCAKALSLVTETRYLGLRASLDKLAEHGTDDTCFTTLLFLVGKTYGRDDVTKSCGKSLDKWKAFLASDRPRFDRVKEVIDWMAKNGQFQYVKDGKARLTESKDFISKAQEELDSWCQDKAFVAPLGLTKIAIEGLDKDVKMLGLNVRKAWAGAIE